MSTHLHTSIARAAAFATTAHEGQTRDDGGGPYIKHPERVAAALALDSVFNAPESVRIATQIQRRALGMAGTR